MQISIFWVEGCSKQGQNEKQAGAKYSPQRCKLWRFVFHLLLKDVEGGLAYNVLPVQSQSFIP